MGAIDPTWPISAIAPCSMRRSTSSPPGARKFRSSIASPSSNRFAGQRYTKIPASETGSGEAEAAVCSGARRRGVGIDDDLPHHLRMESALIVERSRFIEGEGEALTRLERARF